MLFEVSPFRSYSVILDNDGSEVPRLLNRVTQSGVSLLAFTESQINNGKTRVDLVTADTAAAVGGLRETGTGLLVTGENWPSPLTDALVRLSNAHIGVAGTEAISSRAGSFEALIWIEREEIDRAAAVLRPIGAVAIDDVEESSLESFPASDPPSWAMR